MATRSAKGFTPQPDQPAKQPEQQRPQSSGDGVSNGVSLVLTHQAQQTADHLAVAAQFSKEAGKALAHQAHDLTSGQHFMRSFQEELARLQHEQPPSDWDAFDFSQLEAVIADVKKPSLPPQTINFLPGK